MVAVKAHVPSRVHFVALPGISLLVEHLLEVKVERFVDLTAAAGTLFSRRVEGRLEARRRLERQVTHRQLRDVDCLNVRWT